MPCLGVHKTWFSKILLAQLEAYISHFIPFPDADIVLVAHNLLTSVTCSGLGPFLPTKCLWQVLLFYNGEHRVLSPAYGHHRTDAITLAICKA